MARTEHPRLTSWDGTRIAFGVRGEPVGDRVCLFVNGVFGTDSYWVFVQRLLALDHRLVTFDLRGHGGSDPPADPAHVGVSDVARDVRAVLDHVGAARAVLFGFSYGVQVALEAWRLFPERIAGFVLASGSCEDPLSPVFGLGVPPRAWRATLGNLARFLPHATQVAYHGAARLPIWHSLAHLAGASRADLDLMRPFYDHQARVHVPTAIRLSMEAGVHSARDLLAGIRVPTLVIAGGKDRITPPSRMAILRDTIPGASWLEVPEGTHTTLIEAPEVIGPTVREWIDAIRWSDQGPEGGA